MNLSAFSNGESRFQVGAQQLSFLDNFQQRSVNFDLFFLLSVEFGLFSSTQFIARLKNGLFSNTTLNNFRLGEMVVVDCFSFDSGNVHFGGSWNDIGLVDSFERNSVDFVRTSDQ